jgi:beta-xylosidase
MTYEGVRGPGSGDPGDTQFGLGLARSVEPVIDGPWEKFPGNPIIMDMPGNIGVGHADMVVINGNTYLYTTTSNASRGRYILVWK